MATLMNDAQAAPAPPPSGPSVGPAASPLSPEQWRQLTDARQRRKRIDRAVKVATFGGWTTAIIAALALPFVFMDWTSGLIALGLGVVAYHEFKGRAMLRAADPAAARLLGWNQVGFGVLIIIYALWRILSFTTGPGPYAQAIAQEPMLAGTLKPIEGLVTYIMVAVYVTLIVGTILFQGGTAWFYFTREKYLRSYREQTPDWAVQLLQHDAG